MLLAAALVLALPQAPRASAPPQHDAPPNVVLILLDDVGVDMVGAYGEAPQQAPCTPSLDALAAEGLLFRNVWANPICSPTRAALLTGKHGFRTGIGSIVPYNATQGGLSVDELLLPEVLPGYANAAVGKWHLAYPYDRGDGHGPLHPLNSGFDSYVGSLYNLEIPAIRSACQAACGLAPYGYTHWAKTVGCTQFCTTTYATTDSADEALAAAQAMPSPWFLYLAFNAAHTPYHVAPPHLCPGLASCACPIASPTPTIPEQVKSAVEALDSEVGRVIASLRAADPNLIVLVVGDNGTDGKASQGPVGGCFGPDHAKQTLYQGGVRVPLIAAGPGIAPGEVAALASIVDLFATVVELTDSPAVPGTDSVSLVPYLRGATAPLRATVYSERFSPNGLPFAPTTHTRTVRNATHKLIRHTDIAGAREELYDLVADPCETLDLCVSGSCATLTGADQLAYDALVAELTALGVYP